METRPIQESRNLGLLVGWGQTAGTIRASQPEEKEVKDWQKQYNLGSCFGGLAPINFDDCSIYKKSRYGVVSIATVLEQ